MAERVKAERTRWPGIYKREGTEGPTFYVVSTVVGVDGKRRKKWQSGFSTLKDARAAQVEISSRLKAGTYVEPSKLNLREWIEDHWLVNVERSIRPSTFESYSGMLRRHVLTDEVLSSVYLQQISTSMVNGLYGKLAAKGLSATTIRYAHTILRRCLADAAREDRLARNPADNATPPKTRAKQPPATWTADELRRFLAHVAEDRLYAAYRFAAMTGVRRGELLGLKWSALDLEAARTSISETLIGAREASTPKTDTGRRSIALDPETVAALKAHKKRQAEERIALGPAYQDSGLVFCREDGTPGWPRTFSRAFEKQIEAAGLPSIPLKNLRHTHATLALAAGIHPKVVQERLGHSTISITLDTYSRVIPAMAEDAATTVAALVQS